MEVWDKLKQRNYQVRRERYSVKETGDRNES